MLRRGPARREKRRMRSRQDARPRLERRRMKRTRTEDGHLLGNECNFIVNLSLSEGKQWYDLCTICPCNLSPLPRPLLLVFFVLSSSRSPWPSSTFSSVSSSLAPPGELWLGSPRRVSCARFRERRMRVRYVDAVVGAAVSRHRIYRGRTARRYVKEGAAANLSTCSIADRYLGRSTCIPSILCFTFAYISFFFFLSLSLSLSLSSVALDAPRRVALTIPFSILLPRGFQQAHLNPRLYIFS